MAKFRKKPVVIEAIQFDGTFKSYDRICDWADVAFPGNTQPSGLGVEYFLVETLEGKMRADIGDWIIRGVSGEFYPCKPDIFQATYDPVTEDQ